MADKKISQLTNASTPLAGTEVLPIVQSSATVKVATNDLTVKNVRSNATTGILQIAGPAAAATRTMTVPDANFTVARTDAANSFTADQTLSTGNLVVGTAAKGVNFTANTPAAGMTSQLLNWYEEGTWTPTVEGGATAGTYTLSNTVAYYTRVGNQVTLWASFGFSAASGGTDYFRILGAPFSYKAGSKLAGSITCASLNTTAASSNGMVIANDASVSAASFLVLLSIDNAAQEVVQISAVSVSTTVQFCITYTVS